MKLSLNEKDIIYTNQEDTSELKYDTKRSRPQSGLQGQRHGGAYLTSVKVNISPPKRI
mgnify:CR=1 FL=1